MNLGKDGSITVNEAPVSRGGKKELKSGDIISLAGKTFKWESNADFKRKLETIEIRTFRLLYDYFKIDRVALLTKSERKIKRSKCMKTKQRITIHRYLLPLFNGDHSTEFLVSRVNNIEGAHNITGEKLSAKEPEQVKNSGAVTPTKVLQTPKRYFLSKSGTLTTWITSEKSSPKVKTPKVSALEPLMNETIFNFKPF